MLKVVPAVQDTDIDSSVASAKKFDTRLENEEREPSASLRMMPMRKVSMMPTIRMPTTAQ
jgi:hypothetical protein